MLTFLFKRLAVVVPTFIGITLLVFSLIRMIPGDPVEAMSGERGMDPERHARLLHEFGLDRPLPVQYGEFVWKALHGDLGFSIVSHEPVLSEFLDRFPATFELALCAILFAAVVGIPAGMLAAVKRNTPVDYGVMGVSLAGYSMPIFWWALLLILYFSVHLDWTPVSGRLAIEFDPPRVTGLMLIDTWLSGEEGAFRSALSHLILPAIALGSIPLAIIARITRASVLDVQNEDYVRTARAKGLPPRQVDSRHVLRNAMLPISTIIGLQTGLLLSGAVLTETVFAWPGIGSWLKDAIFSRDYPVLQGGILFLAVVFVVVNLLVDISYAILNPRIRLS